MPRSLRSVLGSSHRVSKPSAPGREARAKKEGRGGDDSYEERLDDLGTLRLLAEDVSLRDVVQAMRYIRSRMFTPLPRTGFHAQRTAELLNYRASLPPLVTAAHLHAVLHSPSQVEREVAELVSRGVLRRLRVERRGGLGEALIECRELEMIVRRAAAAPETKGRYLDLLAANPASQTLPGGSLTSRQMDELVRAGLATSTAQASPGSTLRMRPEDRTSITSIESVSRFASGSLSAVGGRNAVHLGGGGGGAPRLNQPGAMESSSSDFRIAVPGQGRYLKLAEGVVDWLREAMGRTPWGEGPEPWLKEKFEGGGLYGRRWKDFWGVEWDWALGQAVGLGAVELFQTRAVGRGVRWVLGA